MARQSKYANHNRLIEALKSLGIDHKCYIDKRKDGTARSKTHRFFDKGDGTLEKVQALVPEAYSVPQVNWGIKDDSRYNIAVISMKPEA